MDTLRQRNESPTKIIYTLADRDVMPGVELEFQTPLGWVRGCFEWSGSMFQWARLIVNYTDDKNDMPMIIVLPPGARCRWPDGTTGNQSTPHAAV